MPYYYGYGFDWTYFILVLPCILLSLWASSSVNSTFNKYSRVLSHRHITGADAAQRVFSAYALHPRGRPDGNGLPVRDAAVRRLYA